jgi:MerR family transcriptional regulator, light-induced transcriptional regulator
LNPNFDIESVVADKATLSIGDVVTATGVGEATLRAWERRFGFPEPRREPSGHRRYSAADVERIRSVVRERERGLALAVAIERVAAEGSGPPSLFAPLRERRPDLLPVALRKPQMVSLSRAVEEESAARAERALMIGAFQQPRFYRESEERWRRLARGAGLTFVLACFDAVAAPEGAPVEVPIASGQPVADEWAVICLAPGYSACLIGWETVERARGYLDRIPDSSQRSQLRLAGAITARAFAQMS